VFYYKHIFKNGDENPKKSKDKAEKHPFLELNANYTKEYEADSSRYTTTEVVKDYLPTTLTFPNLQDRPEFIWTDQSVIKVDYTLPFGKKNKLEIGGHYTQKFNDDDYQFWAYARGNNEWLPDSSRLNRFVFNSAVYSGYVTYSNMIGKKFGYELGVRADQTNTSGSLLNKKDVVVTNDYFTWFPTAHLIYKLQKGEDLRLSYTRRTNRPSNSQLNPTINYSNPYLLKQGNINLLPEFTHSVEFSYSKEWERHSLSAAAYYKYSDNQIARLVTYDSLVDISTVTYQNAAKRTNYGAELVAKNQLAIWWDLVTTGNVYYTEFLNDFALGGGTSSSGYGYDAKLISQMHWGKNTQLQIVGNYTSPRVLAQGQQYAQWSANLGFRQYFFDKKFSIGLNVQDIFNSLHTESSTRIDAVQFSQHQDRKKESRIALLTLTYRFGVKPTEQKGKKNAADPDLDQQHELKNDAPDVD
jgi:outer membrane receptor protein involved in Fe transport